MQSRWFLISIGVLLLATGGISTIFLIRDVETKVESLNLDAPELEEDEYFTFEWERHLRRLWTTNRTFMVETSSSDGLKVFNTSIGRGWTGPVGIDSYDSDFKTIEKVDCDGDGRAETVETVEKMKFPLTKEPLTWSYEVCEGGYEVEQYYLGTEEILGEEVDIWRSDVWRLDEDGDREGDHIDYFYSPQFQFFVKINQWESIRISQLMDSYVLIDHGQGDADGDMLGDGVEEFWGWDPNNADTDGDGVDDLYDWNPAFDVHFHMRLGDWAVDVTLDAPAFITSDPYVELTGAVQYRFPVQKDSLSGNFNEHLVYDVDDTLNFIRVVMGMYDDDSSDPGENLDGDDQYDLADDFIGLKVNFLAFYPAEGKWTDRVNLNKHNMNDTYRITGEDTPYGWVDTTVNLSAA